MPAIFEFPLVVEAEQIDVLGHANNVWYVEWMQQAALAHTAAQGWPASRYQTLGVGWVVREHRIEYRQPARLGDRVVVRTWVASMKRVTSLRRYDILRHDGRELLARAETTWAFIRYDTGQPTRVPREIIEAFQIVADPPA